MRLIGLFSRIPSCLHRLSWLKLGLDLADICITSNLTLSTDPLSGEAFVADDPDIRVVVHVAGRSVSAAGKFCRMGQHARDVCLRCDSVLAQTLWKRCVDEHVHHRNCGLMFVLTCGCGLRSLRLLSVIKEKMAVVSLSDGQPLRVLPFSIW